MPKNRHAELETELDGMMLILESLGHQWQAHDEDYAFILEATKLWMKRIRADIEEGPNPGKPNGSLVRPRVVAPTPALLAAVPVAAEMRLAA